MTNAFLRVIGLVVQPGIEFGNHNIIRYDRAKAQGLAAVLNGFPALVFEAHPTDYQGAASLCELVSDSFAILKIGPELTFSLRERLYALDLIASDLVINYGERALMKRMETLTLNRRGDWHRDYYGTKATRHMLRHYALSD